MHDTVTNNTVQGVLVGWLAWFCNVVNSLDYNTLTHVLTLVSIAASAIVFSNGAIGVLRRIRRATRRRKAAARRGRS